MADAVTPTLSAAHARIAAVDPDAYARTRNAIDGAVTGLSPYLTHGFVSTPEVLADVAARHRLTVQHRFVFELGWREYFRHVWAHRGDGILRSLHAGPLPDAAYATRVPPDVRQAATGIPAIDRAVRTLHATGLLHNHARLWLASYLVHLRKVHWRTGADWLYAQLLDGDLASNHLSWQWVAGTGSRKPYLFNAENVARHAPPAWHSPGSPIDVDYDTLARWAHGEALLAFPPGRLPGRLPEPRPADRSDAVATTAPDPADVADRAVHLVHPWSLGPLPDGLPEDVVVVGVFVLDFHRDWPWHPRRWRFVGQRMAELAAIRWSGEAAEIGRALRGARRVTAVADPHLSPWLARWADCLPAPMLFPPVTRRCDSFSSWWQQVSRGESRAADLIGAATR